jgi:hypothetical protein
MKQARKVVRSLTSSPRRTLQTLVTVTGAVFAAPSLWTLLTAVLTVMGALIDLTLIGAATALTLLLVAKWRAIYDAVRPEILDALKTVFGRISA